MTKSAMGDVSESWQRDFENYNAFVAAVGALQAGRIVRRRLESVLSELGMTTAQWTIMTTIEAAPSEGLPFGRLAEALEVHATTVANAVDKMSGQGWMRREAVDGRTTLAVLTPEGHQRLERAQHALAEIGFGFGEASSNSLDQFVTVLDELLPGLGLPR